MPYGSTSDVASLWRPLTVEEQIQADRLLASASRIIDRESSNVAARIAAGTLDADLVGDIAAQMVIRRMQNPEGLRDESLDDWRGRRDDATSSGALYLTDDERRLLSESRSRAFSVKLSR